MSYTIRTMTTVNFKSVALGFHIFVVAMMFPFRARAQEEGIPTPCATSSPTPQPTPSPVPTLPSNDDCFDAIPLFTNRNQSAVTLNATHDGTVNCGATAASPDVWYRFTPSNTGNATVRVIGASASLDPVLAIFSECGSGELACNDDCVDCGLYSSVTISAQAGHEYFVCVSGFNGSSGSATISLTCSFCPTTTLTPTPTVSPTATVSPTPHPNDNCANATQLCDGVFFGHLGGATNDGTAECGNSDPEADVWYRYTAAATGCYSINFFQNLTPTSVISIHPECGADSVLCAINPLSFNPLNVNAEAGETFLIRVSADPAGFSPRPFSLRIGPCSTPTPPPTPTPPAPLILLNEGAGNQVGAAAITDLGLYFTKAANDQDFMDRIPGESWAVVVLNRRGWSSGVAMDPLIDYIAEGGKAVVGLTDLDAYPLLAAALDATATIDAEDTDANIYRWNPGHPIFSAPFPIDDFKVLPFSSDSGDMLEAINGAQALAGFAPTPTAGRGAIIFGNEGRTFCDGMSLDFIRENEWHVLSNQISFLIGAPPSLGDFDGSGCTDIGDFLFLLDNWQATVEGHLYGIDDFLNLLDSWQTGPACP